MLDDEMVAMRAVKKDDSKAQWSVGRKVIQMDAFEVDELAESKVALKEHEMVVRWVGSMVFEMVETLELKMGLKKVYWTVSKWVD